MDVLIPILLPPFLACLVLTGIHTYLGLHVVSRGVIFVDLALAQIAALGSTFAFLVGFAPSSQQSYLYSLVFTFIGAAIFSISRLKDQRVPQEAIIGIVFAVASAAAILIADRSPQGAEHVAQMLSGSILWVNWSVIWKTLGIYTLIGIFHFIFRKQFLMISMHPEEALQRGMSVRWWDFVFYMSFGFVITSSVAIAGILLVFCFLIIPAVIGMLYSKHIIPRLVIGWISGTLVSVSGLLLSYHFDFPSGPAVVCTFGAFLLLASLLSYVLKAEHKISALARVWAGGLAFSLLLLAAFQLRPEVLHFESSVQTELERVRSVFQELRNASSDSTQNLALSLKGSEETVKRALQQGQLDLDQRVLQHLAEAGENELIPLLQGILEVQKDPWLRFYTTESLLSLGVKENIHDLINLLEPPIPPLLKAQVVEELRSVSGRRFGFDPLGTPEANEGAVNRWEVWWHDSAERLVWNDEQKAFVFQ